MALLVLHCIAPIVTAAYCISAKTASATNGIIDKNQYPYDSLFSRGDTGDGSESEGTDDADGLDSDTEDSDGDKLLREQQRKRLKDSGTSLNYLSEFTIFPLDRYCQERIVLSKHASLSLGSSWSQNAH